MGAVSGFCGLSMVSGTIFEAEHGSPLLSPHASDWPNGPASPASPRRWTGGHLPISREGETSGALGQLEAWRGALLSLPGG